jgi:hypothetical protein
MQWIAIFLMFFCAMWTSGCSDHGMLMGPSDSAGTTTTTTDDGTTTDDSTTTTTDDGTTFTTSTTPTEPPVCNGVCVDTPPATYTGPSLFWLGPPELVPECPPETPYQGLQGYVTGVMFPQLARECRITPSDLCPTEGKTCSPTPQEGYYVCIHHVDAGAPCPPEYPGQSTVDEMESGIPLTLCCGKMFVPG